MDNAFLAGVGPSVNERRERSRFGAPTRPREQDGWAPKRYSGAKPTRPAGMVNVATGSRCG